jgi:hypothetical protein
MLGVDVDGALVNRRVAEQLRFHAVGKADVVGGEATATVANRATHPDHRMAGEPGTAVEPSSGSPGHRRAAIAEIGASAATAIRVEQERHDGARGGRDRCRHHE